MPIAQTSPEPTSAARARARDYIALLAARRFDDAASWGDDAVREKLPAEKLAEVWSKISGDEGAFVRLAGGPDRALAMDGLHVVPLECEYERGTILVTVTIDAEHRIAGLLFGPHQVTWLPPPYADPAAFSERELRVGIEPKLSATLTVPRTTARVPVVVLVHGSGPNDRDESHGGMKLFRDLAWGLASRGVAVLRYDKRTYQYGGTFAGRAFTYDEEAVHDARAALADAGSLPEIDPQRVFLLGHSLGANLAPRIANGLAAPTVVAGLIMLAGSTRPDDLLMREQTRYVLGVRGVPEPEIQAALAALDEAYAKARAEGPPEELIVIRRSSLPRSYVREELAYDPVRAANAVDVPMLLLQGERDYQVTAADDFAGWKRGLAAKANATYRLYPALNHHFVPGSGKPGPAEYAALGHAEPQVIADIAAWIAGMEGASPPR